MKEIIITDIDREQNVIGWRYEQEMTFKDIADLLNLHPSRITQIHQDCIWKLKILISDN